MSSDEDGGRDSVRVFGPSGGGKDGWQGLQETTATDRRQSRKEKSRKNPDGRMEKATSTQQHDTDDPHPRTDWYEPPYPPSNLAYLKERSETHARCVHAKSQAVAGHGFDVVPHPQSAANTDSDEDPPGEETVREFWYSSDTTFQLGPDEQPATAAEVHEQAWDDYESIGWLAIEGLINNMTGEPTGLAHVPAHTIRSRMDGPGYVQIDPDSDTIEGYYAPAGARYPRSDDEDPVFVDADTGETGNKIGDVGTVANELLVIRNYSALAPHYGIPDIVPAMETLAGDVAARSYNRRFFENDGMPRFAVLVEGGELSDRAWTELEQKFKDLRQPENSHRGVLIEAVSGVKSSFESSHNVSLKIEPLTVDVQEDASFIEYRKENEHDLLSAHGVPPVVVNRTEQINYANAQAQRRHFAQEVIRPKQEKLSQRLYRWIHQQMLDVDGWTIEFRLVGGEDQMRQAEISKLRVEGTAGVITVNEAREIAGQDPLDDDRGKKLVADLAQNSGAGGAGGPSSGGGEAADVASGNVESAQGESEGPGGAANGDYSDAYSGEWVADDDD